MADDAYKPDNDEREALVIALARAYPPDMKAFESFLSQSFGAVFAAQVELSKRLVDAINSCLNQIEVATTRWEEFLTKVRRDRSDSISLSAQVESILLSGSLAGLRGTLEQLAVPAGTGAGAFERCQPTPPEDAAGPPPPTEGGRIAWYASRLVPKGRGSRAGAIPLLRFVELIRREVDPLDAATATRLNQWIETTAARVSVDDDDRTQILMVTRQQSPWYRGAERRAQAQAATNERVVLFQVRPARDVVGTAGPYGLEAWLMLPDGSGEDCVWKSTEPWKRDRVVRLLSARPSGSDQEAAEDGGEPSPLDAVRDALAERGVHYSNVRVELVLPVSLVWSEPDQSPIVDDDGIGRTVLGAAHALAVRVWERQKRLRSSMKPEIQALLSTRLAARCWLVRDKPPAGEPPDAPPPADVLKLLWVDANSPTGDDLTNRLRNDEFLGCVMGFNPLDLSEQQRATFLRSITGANVPIIVWSRKCPPDGTKLWKCFHDIFHTQTLGSWTRQVFEQRRQAKGLAADKWHLGRHLSFVWEDPRRLPPDIRPSRASTPQ